MNLPIFGLLFGEGDGDTFGVGDGIAIAPITSYFGVGVVNGIGIFLAIVELLPKVARNKSPLKKLTTNAAVAVAMTVTRCLTRAQPTGQFCVKTVPSAL